MPAWPTYAKLLFEGFGEQRETAAKATEMESGPPKVVLIKSRVMVRRPIRAFLTTTADYLAFLTWFETDLKQGTLWFDWYDPVRKVTKKGRIKGGELGDSSPLAPLKINAGWIIPMTLETWQ
jgi:hypothetical protein